MKNPCPLVICIALLANWFQTSSCSRATIQDLTSKLCPYLNFCHHNASEVFARHMYKPCCNRCFCGKECLASGSCCPDALKGGHGVSDETFFRQLAVGTCTSTIVKPKQLISPKSGIELRLYRIIDSCPTNGSSAEQVLCEAKTQTRLSDLIWVSDLTNGTVFKNRHCAECNNIYEFIPWKLRTNCIEVLLPSLGTLSDILSFDACKMFVEPPDMFEKTLEQNEVSCQKISGFSRCNETGKWQDYNDVIEKACRASEWRFGVAPIHKNIYCYICNVRELSEVPSLCFDRPNDPGPGSFSVLLAYDIEPTLVKDQAYARAKDSCRPGEIKDNLLKKCRTLYCPVGSLAYFGSCRNTFLEIANLNVNMAFIIKPERRHPIPTGLLIDIHPPVLSVYNEMRNIAVTAFQNASCRSCEYSLWAEHQNLVGFVFWIKLNLRGRCSLEFVRAKSAEVDGREIVLRYRNETTIYSVGIETRPDERLFQNLTSSINEIIPYSNRYCSSTNFRLTEIRVCPQVELRYDEVLVVPNPLKKRFLSFFPDDQPTDNTSTVEVCLEEYERVMKHSIANGLKLDKLLLITTVNYLI